MKKTIRMYWAKLLVFLKKPFRKKESAKKERCIGYHLTKSKTILALVLTEEGVRLKEVTEIQDLERFQKDFFKDPQTEIDPWHEE